MRNLPLQLHPLLLMGAVACMPLSGLQGSIPDAVNNSIPVARQVGISRVSVLVWDLYDISLYAPEGRFNEAVPFALRLQYLRSIKGDMIAEKSVEEMRKQGISEVKLAAWFVQLKTIFPDVHKGCELIGIFESGQPTQFYLGAELLGQVMDPDFGESFSLIWLGDKTAKPAVRQILIGKQG